MKRRDELFKRESLSNDDFDVNENGKKRNWFRACLHGAGGPQIGEVTRLGGVTRLSI